MHQTDWPKSEFADKLNPRLGRLKQSVEGYCWCSTLLCFLCVNQPNGCADEMNFEVAYDQRRADIPHSHGGDRWSLVIVRAGDPPPFAALAPIVAKQLKCCEAGSQRGVVRRKRCPILAERHGGQIG